MLQGQRDREAFPVAASLERPQQRRDSRSVGMRRHTAPDFSAHRPSGCPSLHRKIDEHARQVRIAAAIQLLDQDRLADAHLAFSEWYGNPALTPEDETELIGLLDRLAGTVIYSRQHLLERPHEVQPGETLEHIASLYEVPWELLANINGIRDPKHLRTGEQLKVVRGPFNALVELDKFRLTLFVQGRYAGRFKIGVGKDKVTPEGEFTVWQKIPNPTYYGTPVIDQDDPNNPLGEYMLDLGDKLMIHGTNDPQSIGRAESKGCIRLDNRDIKDVYEILSVKTENSAGSIVTIRR